MQYFKKNELKPHLNKYWKIPPDGNAKFVAKMEDVLEMELLVFLLRSSPKVEKDILK